MAKATTGMPIFITPSKMTLMKSLIVLELMGLQIVPPVGTHGPGTFVCPKENTGKNTIKVVKINPYAYFFINFIVLIIPHLKNQSKSHYNLKLIKWSSR